MRCRKHPGDLSSGVGICASCLRDRLLAITEPQKQRNCAKLHAYQPPPPSFPRSVSPYSRRRKTETTTVPWTWSLYTTPQLTVGVKKTKSSGGAFSKLLLGLFRSKWYKHDFDSNPGVSADSCSTPHSNMKKKIRSFWMERRACRNPNRVMSPERYSGGSSESFHQTPRRTPAAGHSRTISGLGFFLSPLVRPRNENGVPTEAAASFCKNRSRKLAEFGRHNSRH